MVISWGSNTGFREKRIKVWASLAAHLITKQGLDLWHNRKKESEVAQSCLTLWDSVCCSLPGSSIHGIFQARILEWLPFPPPGDLPNLGIEPRPPTLQANFLLSESPEKPWHCRVSANPELKGWQYPLIIRALTVFISMWDRYLWKRPEIFKWWDKAFPRFDFGKSIWS